MIRPTASGDLYILVSKKLLANSSVQATEAHILSFWSYRRK
ncbi:MAG: hypothetical protein ACI9JP_002537, partial [Granulosicoccus sp.]